MEKLKKLLSLAYLAFALLLSLTFLVDMSVIFIPFLALTLLLVPKFRDRALNIPLVQILAKKPAFIYAASLAFFVIWAETRPEQDQSVAVENKTQRESSSDVGGEPEVVSDEEMVSKSNRESEFLVEASDEKREVEELAKKREVEEVAKERGNKFMKENIEKS